MSVKGGLLLASGGGGKKSSEERKRSWVLSTLALRDLRS